MSDPEPFGGLPPDVIHDLVGSGYATWVLPHADGKTVIAAHGATVVNAPQERVYDTVTDFEGLPRHLSLLAPSTVRSLGDDRIEVDLEARVGLALFKLSVPLRFRFRKERPHALHHEAYLGGAFQQCAYGMRTWPLEGGRTLLVLSFHGDVRSLGMVARVFLERVPELELAIAGNMVVIPLMALGAIAERAEGRPPAGPTETVPVHERVAAGAEELGPALDGGLLTVGRLGLGGTLADVCSVGRVGAPPERLWPVVTDPTRLSRVVSFIDGGKVGPVAGGLSLELRYKARFGPLRKTYTVAARATAEPPHRLDATVATTDGVPATYGDVLVPDGRGGSIYAHRYSTDLRRDWLSRRFLSAHPELERLIAQYPPMMQLIALQAAHGRGA